MIVPPRLPPYRAGGEEAHVRHETAPVHHAARRCGGLRSPQYAVEFLKRGKGMPRIVHIAIKVEDLEKATKFYEEVFGFRQTSTGYARGHVSRHLTDGNIDLALMVYDSEDVAEAKLSRSGPCIHHWGIEVEDRDSYVAKIKANGGTIISEPGEGALKFRAPDGTVAEIVGVGRLGTGMTSGYDGES